MQRSEQLNEFAMAFAKFQAEVSNPKTTAKNPQFGSSYAPLDTVINTVKPILAKYGLSVFQSTGSDGENVVIKTMILHESGQFVESEPLVLPAYQLKKGGAKEFNAQGAGSAITYGRRYSLSAALNLSSETDDDANHVSGYQGQQQQKPGATETKQQQPPKQPGPELIGQVKLLVMELAGFSEDSSEASAAIIDTLRGKLNAKFKGVEQLNVSQANKAIEYLNAWIKQKKDKQNQGA